MKPKALSFTSLQAQTVTVMVKERTTVYAASEDDGIATVSPFEQAVHSSKGGSLRFTIAARTDKPRTTLVCFPTTEWRFTCVDVRIGAAAPSPSPTATPRPTATSTPTATPIPTPAATPFTFVPVSPLHLGPDAVTTVTVSEPNYSGLFSVSACSITSSAGGSCVPDTNGQECTALDNGSATSVFFYPTSGTANVTFAVGVPIGPPNASVSCQFTVQDTQGNSEVYTVNAP